MFARDQLGTALRELLRANPAPDGRPRRVHASAIIPDDGTGPRLLALTQEHFFAIPLPERGAPDIRALAQVTSLSLRRSVLGVNIASHTGATRWVVPFPIVAVQSCLDIFAALRQALTYLPVEATGPDLSGEDEDADAVPRQAGEYEPTKGS